MSTPSFAELFAPIARRELNKVFCSPPRPWRPLSIRDRTYFGHKRRARRARGRRIEQQQRDRSFFDWAMNRIRDAEREQADVRSYPLPRVMMLDEIDSFDFGLTEEQARAEIAAETERWRKLIDPSMGETWKEHVTDA